MENSKTFQYNGNNITFLSGNGDTMVNATEMAKVFGKRVRQWFDNPGTHEFVKILAEIHGIKPIAQKRTSLNTKELASIYPQLITVIKGGMPGKVKQGTWIHEDVALEFARWLSPKFAIWCNDKLKELFRYGFTATDTALEKLIKNPQAGIKIFTALKEEREKHKTAIHRERDMSASWLNIACNQIRELNEAYETAQMYEIIARRYFFLTQGYRKLAIENNIRIPAKLKMTKYNYEADLKQLRNGK